MNKSKQQKRLENEHHYLHNKVEQMENERDEKGNRSWQTKDLIKRHKKMKLKVKDEIVQIEKTNELKA